MKFGKNEKFFQKDREHPASVAAATEGVAGANAVIFSETEESKARGNPIRKRCCSLQDLHGEKGVFSVKAFQLVIAQVTCCNQIAEFSARCTT